MNVGKAIEPEKEMEKLCTMLLEGFQTDLVKEESSDSMGPGGPLQRLPAGKDLAEPGRMCRVEGNEERLVQT